MSSPSSPRGIAFPDAERAMQHRAAPPLTVRCSACHLPLQMSADAQVTTQRSAPTIMVTCSACGNAQRVPVAS